MGFARDKLGIELNPINVIESAGRKIDDEILQPVKNVAEAMIDDPKKLLALGVSIAFPGAGAALGSYLGLSGVAAQVVGQAMLNTAINGGDVKSAVIAAAIPVVGKAAASSIGSTLASSGIEGTLNKAITNSLVQGGTAAALGKDPTAAFLFGGASAAVPVMTADIPGFDDLPDFAKQAINSGIAAELTGAEGGAAAVNSAMAYAKSEASKYFRDLGIPQKSDTIGDYFASSGPGYYNESSGKYVQDPLGGMQGPLNNESGTRDPELPWEYNQTAKDVWENDAGNQIDLSYIPSSQQPLSGADIMASAGATAPKSPGRVTPPPAGATKPDQGVDVDQIMALLGGQQAPTVVSSGQDNAADVQLMEDIFGTDLSAPPAGDLNAQTRELARLLRS